MIHIVIPGKKGDSAGSTVSTSLSWIGSLSNLAIKSTIVFPIKSAYICGKNKSDLSECEHSELLPESRL